MRTSLETTVDMLSMTLHAVRATASWSCTCSTTPAMGEVTNMAPETLVVVHTQRLRRHAVLAVLLFGVGMPYGRPPRDLRPPLALYDARHHDQGAAPGAPLSRGLLCGLGIRLLCGWRAAAIRGCGERQGSLRRRARQDERNRLHRLACDRRRTASRFGGMHVRLQASSAEA